MRPDPKLLTGLGTYARRYDSWWSIVPRSSLSAIALPAIALGGAAGCGQDEPVSAVPTLACSDVRGEAHDLAPWSRLRASATRLRPVFPWPREAEDGVGALRDDDSTTGYKPPVGEEASIEIDFAPWVGRPVALSTIEIELEPPTARIALGLDLLDSCGGSVVRRFDSLDPNGPIDLASACAGCVSVRIKAEDAISIGQILLHSEDGNIVDPLVDAPRKSAPRWPRSGVIEGFYGVPWSWRERRNMVASLSAWGLEAYLYAPKNDPLHRDAWRTPYAAEAIARFGSLAALARDAGVRLVFGISPFVDYAAGAASATDYQALYAKLLPFFGAGVSGFALLADDIEFSADVKVDAALGAQHAEVSNRLLSDLRAIDASVALWFVPTVYSDSRIGEWPGGEAYLRELRALDPSIMVMWTGTDTSSSTMSGPEMQRVTSLVERPPLIWDNFWANDGGDGYRGRILLGPLAGRSPDLTAAVQGILHNPSIQGSLSRLSLGTFVDWLEHPFEQPAAERARNFSARSERRFLSGAAANEPGDLETLRFTMEVFDGDAQRSPPTFARFDRAIGALRAAITQNRSPTAEVETLLSIAGRMAAYDSEVHHSGLDALMVDELLAPAAKVRLQGEAALHLLDALAQRLSGKDGAAELGAAQQALDASDRQRFQLGQLELVGLKETVQSVALSDVVQRIEAASPAPACVAGQELVWKPFASPDLAVSVVGLPEASVEGDTVRFTPRYGGRFTAVVTGSRRSEAGWAFRMYSIACRPGR